MPSLVPSIFMDYLPLSSTYATYITMTEMGKITVGYGVVLILLGLGFYMGTGAKSVTALIPAFLGAPMLICGFLSAKEHLRKHVMHVAATLGLVGIAGGAMGLSKLPALISGAEVARPAAALLQNILFFLSVIFVILCVRSFIKARIAMEAEAKTKT
jgi:hypothetical protein